MTSDSKQAGGSRRYLVSYSLQELLINVAALMEHHSRQLLNYTEKKTEFTLDQKIAAASYVKTCESMVNRIQATIRNAEMLG